MGGYMVYLEWKLKKVNNFLPGFCRTWQKNKKRGGEPPRGGRRGGEV